MPDDVDVEQARIALNKEVETALTVKDAINFQPLSYLRDRIKAWLADNNVSQDEFDYMVKARTSLADFLSGETDIDVDSYFGLFWIITDWPKDYIEKKRRESAKIIAKERKTKDRNGWSVYFLRSGNYVKIGCSQNVEQRMHDHRCSNPDLELLAVVPGGRSTERNYHQKFSQFRLKARSEWFRYEDKLREAIYALA